MAPCDADMAPSNNRSVNRCGHGHLACQFPINVTVPPCVMFFPWTSASIRRAPSGSLDALDPSQERRAH